MDTIKALIPPAGPRLKFTKLFNEYKSSLEEVLLDITIPVAIAESTSSNSFLSSDDSVASSVQTSAAFSAQTFVASSAQTSFDLIDLDLKEILKKKYPDIFHQLIEEKQIGWCDKQRINRLFVSALTDKYGPFPSKARKANLAQLIVQEFPSLKNHEGSGYVRGYI